MKQLIFLLAVAISTVGCNGFKAIESVTLSNTGTPSSSLCQKPYSPINLKLAANPVYKNAFTQTKMVSDEWSDPSSVRAVSVLVNSQCLTDRPLPSVLIAKGQTQPSSWATAENTLHVQFADSITSEEGITALQNHPCVLGLSPDVIIRRSALPDDPFFTSQLYLDSIDFQETYDFLFESALGLSGQTVVAIIDDGMDMAHPDLRNQLWVNMAEANGAANVDDDGNGYVDDVNGYDFASNVANPAHKGNALHGTHVAGFIAAAADNAVGVSGILGTHTRIMVLNIFGSSESSTIANIDRAIRYAADNGAKVINMSFGGEGRSATTASAIAYALSKGVFLAAAAGNDNRELTNTYQVAPASYASQYEGFVSVGASDVRVGSGNGSCSFSNYSTTYVEISAPGCDTSRNDLGILSTLPNNQQGYLAGTSMATPIVSATAALLITLARDRDGVMLTPAQTEKLLTDTSLVRTNLSTRVSGGRALNLKNATNLVIDQYLSDNEICPAN